jgi:S1-C subfamily serine protease
MRNSLSIALLLSLLACSPHVLRDDSHATSGELPFDPLALFSELPFGAIMRDCGSGLLDLSAPGRGGARILEISPGSVAEQAGFVAGDCIVQLDENSIRSAEDFVRVSRLRAGEEVLLTYLRGQSSFEKRIRLGHFRPKPTANRNEPAP